MKYLLISIVLLVTVRCMAQSADTIVLFDPHNIQAEGRKMTALTNDELQFYAAKGYEVVSLENNVWAWKNDRTRIIKCPNKPVIMKSTDNTSVISLCLACYKNGKINRADACIVVSEGK